MYHVSVMLKFLIESFPFLDSAVKCKDFVSNKALRSLHALQCLGRVYLIFTVAKSLCCLNIFSVIFKSTVALSCCVLPCFDQCWLTLPRFPVHTCFMKTQLFYIQHCLLFCSVLSVHLTPPFPELPVQYARGVNQSECFCFSVGVSISVALLW